MSTKTTVSQMQRRKMNHRVFIWLGLASIVATVLVLQIWRNVEQQSALDQQLKVVQQEEAQVHVQQIELQATLDLLQDDDYVLKLARSRGYFSLPNEIIFNIPEDNPLLNQEKIRKDALGNDN